MGRGNGLRAFNACPVARLHYDVRYLVEPRRELVLVPGEPYPELYDPADACPVKGQQVLFPAPRGYEVGVLLYALVVPGHDRVEVGLDLEYLPVLGVQVVQEVVYERLAHYDELYVDRYGRRLQRGGGDDPVLLPRVLYPDFPVLYHPLEGIVHEYVAQDVHGVHHEVPAVGLVHAPGLYHGEISRGHAELYPELYPAEEVGIGRVGLEDDGRAFRVLVVYDDVDLVALKGGLLLLEPYAADGKGDLLFGPEVVYTVEYIVLYPVQVPDDALELLVLVQELANGRVHDILHDLPVQGVYPVLCLLFDGPCLADRVRELVLHDKEVLLELGALFGRERFELLWAHGLAVLRRDDCEPAYGLLEDEPLFNGLLLEPEKKVPCPLLLAFQDLVPVLLVVL